MLLTAWGAANAQSMAGYTLDATIGTYEEITDGTVIPFVLEDSASMASFADSTLWLELDDYVFIGDSVAYTSDFVAQGMPIGFDFEFDGEMMNQFVFAPNGHIILGKDSVELVEVVGRGYNALTSSWDCINVVGMAQYAGHYASLDTEFSYKVVGESPNRELVVQSKDLVICYQFNWDDVPTNIQIVQYQIRLVEGTNEVKLVYNDWDRSESSYSYSQSTRIGIKADPSNLATVASASGSWNEGVSLTSDDSYLTYSSSYYPSNGLTYTFTPGGACEAPSAQATDLELSTTSIRASGEFTATADADHYLVVMSIGALTEIPTDGVTYSAADSIGNGHVVTWTTDTTFATSDATADALIGSTEYTFNIFAANSFCSGGVTYNTTPLTGSIYTLPAAPTALTVGDVDKTYIEVTAEANAAGDQVIIAYTTEVYTNAWGQDLEYGAFGTPTTDLAVGDSIDGGGYIMYIGEAGTAKIEGLLEDETYHFWAWSYDPDLGISTEGIYVNDHTAGSIPFVADFTEPYVAMPFGWSYECLTSVGAATAGRISTYDGVYITISAADAANGSVFTLTSPWVYLNEDAIGHRVLYDYNMQRYASWSWSAYNTWAEQDSLVLQVSTDGVNYIDFANVNYTNNGQQSASTSFISTSGDLDEYAGEKVKFRVYWRSTASVRMYLNNFEIEEVLACDYPTNVTTSDVVGSSATIGWTSEADLWEIQYKAVDSDEWSSPIEASTNPYTITGLPGNTDMEVQVRTKCSLTEVSNWSKSGTFTSGYSVPFSYTFNSATSLPDAWTLASGELTDSTTFGTDNSLYFGYTYTFRSYYLYEYASTGVNDWLLSPVVDLGDGSVNYNYTFDLFNYSLSSDSTETYNVVVSTDGGKTFSKDNIAGTITHDELPSSYGQQEYTISLKGYTGTVQVGLYIESTEAASYMFIFSAGIEASCASDIVAQTDTITAESAIVSWTSDAEEFLVFSRLAGETTKDYSTTTDKFIELEGLEPRTAYEVGITKMCEVGDTAAVTIVSFTTTAPDACEGATEISATATQYTATLSWVAEAMTYNVRLREKGTETWSEASTTELSYTFSGLSAETTYEYAVQTVCSDYEGDYSDWSETAEVTTMPITCFAPDDITVETTHKAATVTWTGDADSYEVNYREGSSGDWTGVETVDGNELTIEDLTDETIYSLRIKSICSETDESSWSSTVSFTTASIPECVVPSDLTASNIDVNSVTLSWSADESNLTWDVRYRASISTTYAYEYGLEATTCDVTDLEEETAYIWSVMATCDEARTSAWATQGSWSTISGINSTSVSELGVFVSQGVLNVINTENLWIKQMDIYTINGKLVNSQVIEAGENILMPLNSDNAQLIVRLVGNGWSESYTIIVK